MPESNEERQERVHRTVQKLFGDMGYSKAYDYVAGMITKAEPYENKAFWMIVREELVRMNHPVSAAEPKYRTICGQTRFKGEI
jgi:hypothetical protein